MTQDLDAERAVIGAVFASAEECAPTLESLTAGEFASVLHQRVWTAMQALQSSRKPVDLVTVVDQMTRAGVVGKGKPHNASDVAELSRHRQLASACTEYARIVRDKAVLRQIQRAACDAMDSATKGEDPGSILSRLAKFVASADGHSETGCRPARTVADELIRDLQHMAESGQARSFVTGIDSLDRVLWIRPSDLFVIGGRPGTGKSMLGVQVARSIAASGRGVLYVSAEMPDVDQVARAARGFASISSEVFRQPTTPDRVYRAAEAVDRVGRLPMWFTNETRVDVLMRMIRAKARKGEIVAVVVDMLQRLRLSGSNGTMAERLGEASRAFKLLALEERVPVFLLSSMNRSASDDDGDRPTMASLRGSGDIESDADTVLLLHRRDDVVTEWIIGKAREGADGNDRGVLFMKRDFARGGFEEWEDQGSATGNGRWASRGGTS